ncbi:MAG: YkgJ family cysteine cluster protein [Polyangiales bacterium]
MRPLPIYPGVDEGPRPHARAAVFAAIERGARPVDVVGVVARAVDEVVSEHARLGLGLRPACARGCSSCCHQRVELTAPEVLALADHLRGTLDSQAFEALRVRVEETTRALDGVDGRTHHLRQIRCALLDDEGACLAHSARPLACRRAHSTDAKVCEAAHAEPAASRLIPDDPTLSWNTAAVVLGYLEGLEHAGASIDVFELHAALAIALADAHVEAEWLLDRDPFAPARTRTASEVHRALGRSG